MMEQLKIFLRLFSLKRDEVIYTCIQRNIPLTKKNIEEVREIIQQKKKIEKMKNSNANSV
ncbi:hypothetical protein [Flavobacterium sp.]|uniref:hypothetical protein n=1 Tax=Flavobacterium sp. TaxID=239 RepID=UPI00374FF989